MSHMGWTVLCSRKISVRYSWYLAHCTCDTAGTSPLTRGTAAIARRKVLYVDHSGLADCRTGNLIHVDDGLFALVVSDVGELAKLVAGF